MKTLIKNLCGKLEKICSDRNINFKKLITAIGMVLENLCAKLKSWGIDPRTLAKAVCIFLILAILIAIFIIFPKLFLVLLAIAICITMIVLIYFMLE